MSKKTKIAVIIGVIIVIVLCVYLRKAHAAQKGTTVVIKKTMLAEMVAKLKKLDAIEKATPEFELTGLKVAQDSDGKIYVKDTVEIKLKLSELSYTGIGKTNAEVKVLPIKSKEKFISRFGLIYSGEQKENDNYTEFNRAVVYLSFRIAAIRKFALQTIANKERYGIGVSFKITPNTFVITGLNCKYKENPQKDKKAFLGVGFNF